MHGQFVWYELTTPDPDASKRFYQPLVGWSTQPFDNDYSMWTNGGQPIGGIFRLGPEQQAQGIPPNWMPYVEVNNVDESASRASAAGGTVVVPPTEIPNTGRFAVLQDPHGATFGIYKSSSKSDPWDGTNRLGRFSWHELMTTDHKSAFEFYRKLFDWEKTSDFDMGPENGIYQMYGLKGKQYGGMFNRPREMAQVPPFWLPYIHVKDVKAATEAAKQSGAQVVNGPMEVPDGTWIVVLKDPTGAAIALHSGTPKTAKPGKATKKADKKAVKKAVKTAGKKADKKAAKKAKKAAKKAKKKDKKKKKKKKSRR
jgi:predicted enzyme related to lactoylglutathione lyase